MSSTNIPTVGIFNTVTKSQTTSTYNDQDSFNIAVMYNYYDPALSDTNTPNLITNAANSIVLNPIDIDLQDFLGLFYTNNSGYFNVNQTNSTNQNIVLTAQTFSTTFSATAPVSLSSLALLAYSNKNSITVNDIDPRLVLLARKEVVTSQSLATVKGSCIAMSWNNIMDTLISTGSIVTGTSTDIAVVPLTIILSYHSFVLDITLNFTFVYKVSISGYLLESSKSSLNPVIT